MTTPVVRKLAAADARRVAAARAERAAAASRRVAASKRRLLLLSVLGALSISGWILTAMVNFTWAVPALLTALTVGAVELGRRASAAGGRADAELAAKVQAAEVRAGLTPGSAPAGRGAEGSTRGAAQPGDTTVSAGGKPGAPGEAAAPAPSDAPETGGNSAGPGARGGSEVTQGVSSLRVEVDPAKIAEAGDSWTPMPVPPPAYTMKAQVRRKIAEPLGNESATAETSAALESSATDTSEVPDSPVKREAAVQAEAPVAPSKVEHAPGAAVGTRDDEPEATTGSLNVQEILARRRAVG